MLINAGDGVSVGVSTDRRITSCFLPVVEEIRWSPSLTRKARRWRSFDLIPVITAVCSDITVIAVSARVYLRCAKVYLWSWWRW